MKFDVPPYWHESGDVLLQVNDHGIKYKFRVHRFILSMNSSVWEDMFQLGTQSNQDPGPVIDGLPIIPLDDPVKDVCSLLSAFYLGIEDIRETRDLDAALGILRLSHKYQVDRLYTIICNILQESWPLNRVDYFALSQEQRQRVTGSIKLIKAAIVTQSTALLPAAFYELATTPQEKWAENAMDLLGELSSEDVGRLFLGKNRITHRYKTFSSYLLTLLSAGPPRCCNDRRRLVLDLRAEFGAKLLDERLSKLRPEFDSTVTCGTCRGWLFSQLKGVEIDIWKNIPTYFNLPPVEMENGSSIRKVFTG